MNEEELTDIEFRKEIFMRFREQFPEMKDVDFAKVISTSKTNIYKYKTGLCNLSIIDFVKLFPELDWSYVLTGRHEKDYTDKFMAETELRKCQRELLKIANNLQKIEDKLPNIK